VDPLFLILGRWSAYPGRRQRNKKALQWVAKYEGNLRVLGDPWRARAVSPSSTRNLFLLHGHSANWRLSAKRIVVAGDSAGAQLAALVGVSNQNVQLEGEEGEEPAQSSSVQRIISSYGAANLTTILKQSTPKRARPGA
jgi:hypothetical protein